MRGRASTWIAAALAPALSVACYTPRDKELAYDFESRYIALGGTGAVRVHDACTSSPQYDCDPDPVALHEAWFDVPGVFELVETGDPTTVRFAAMAAGDATLSIRASIDSREEVRVIELSARAPDEIELAVGCSYPSLDAAPQQPLLIAPGMPFNASYAVRGDGLLLAGLDELLVDLAPLEVADHSTVESIDRLSLRAPGEPMTIEVTWAVDPDFSFTVDIYDVSRIDGVVIEGPTEIEYSQFPANLAWHDYPTVGGRSGCNERWPRTITALTPSVCNIYDGQTAAELTSPLVLGRALAPGTCQYEVGFSGASVAPQIYTIELRDAPP